MKKRILKLIGFVVIVGLACWLCSCESVQPRAPMDLLIKSRKPGEVLVVSHIETDAAANVAKAFIAPGRGSTKEQGAAVNEALKAETSKQSTQAMSAAAEGAVRAGGAAIGAFAAGVPGLGITTGGQAFTDAVRALTPERGRLISDQYYIGPMPRALSLTVGFDAANEDPTGGLWFLGPDSPEALDLYPALRLEGEQFPQMNLYLDRDPQHRADMQKEKAK